MEGVRITYGREEKCILGFHGKTRRKYTIGRHKMDSRVILKLIVKKCKLFLSGQVQLIGSVGGISELPFL